MIGINISVGCARPSNVAEGIAQVMNHMVTSRANTWRAISNVQNGIKCLDSRRM
ncbi:hypothetical protein [Mycolicibacter icosiumassiliensis]|uniref:hypothetical protein n=1 Tax=Mycolicibacter icosiumassiliensis TaxID=1792835 RepID=UPI000A97E0ED|nr:hypothetical protein [Mycolicibacter icosiumassiliensis]